MKEKKITVREAANIAGVAKSTIDNWRSGAMPEDFLAVKKLAKALNVSFSFLLTGQDEDSELSPSITQVFEDGPDFFEGYAHITIKRLIPRKKGDNI